MNSHPDDPATHPLSPQQRRRLDQLETGLAREAPDLADAFRRWQLQPAKGEAWSAETTVPAWVASVLIVGFAGWIGGFGIALLAAAPTTSWLLPP